ncbi:Bacteriophage P7 related protein [Vibrio crassostreae]|uniref:Bacteriophage P7 related protein n=3 Tax=Vibrionaceae TaxID=641 RepID=A0A822N286_9VIBR|nr:Bacteriophage P7 related protein [Vibrio crassostreae]
MTIQKLSALVVLFTLLGVYFMNKKTVDKALSQFALSARSESRMIGVHGDLKRVVRRAIELTPFDFGITSGKRTAEEQNALFKKGASQLDGYSKKSRHQTGHAIDFVVYDENNKVTWGFSYYEQVSWAFKQAAQELNVPIVWGGDWVSFKDGPHVELDKRVYA